MPLRNLIKRPILIIVDAMLKDTLQDTTSIRMTGKGDDIIEHIIKNKINFLAEKISTSPILGSHCLLSFRTQNFDTLLYHVVPILIMNAVQDTMMELH